MERKKMSVKTQELKELQAGPSVLRSNVNSR